ncbi:MAG: hypothetical protein GKS00_10365 [Alphaproteobacteria bacterium]|nr:hypothetical protein [Alphaproteobacteria bacterium]
MWEHTLPVVWEFTWPLLITMYAVVLVHGCGHLIAARLLGIGVETISIGLGPKLAAFPRDNPFWRICWLPVGGYVRLQTAYEDEGSYGKKIAVSCSGPLLSVLFAFAIFFVLFAIKGVPAIEGREFKLLQLSIVDSVPAAMRSLVWTWRVWTIGDLITFFPAYNSAVTWWFFLVAICSSKFGILNLLPLPTLDGWSILRLILASFAGAETAAKTMKWLLWFVIGLLTMVVAYVIWLDLVEFGIV